MSAWPHVVAVVLAVGIAANGVRRGLEPGFVVATPAPVRDTLRLEGLRAPLRADGRLTVAAALARPGHDPVGPVWLGAPTHLLLEAVEVECRDASQPARVLRAASARWDGGELALAGPVDGEDAAGRPFTAPSARVVDGAIVIGR